MWPKERADQVGGLNSPDSGEEHMIWAGEGRGGAAQGRGRAGEEGGQTT